MTDVTNIGKGKDVETVSVSHVSDRWCTPSQLSSPRPCAPIEEQWEDGSKVRDDFHTGPRLRQTINLSRALFPEDTVAVQVAAPPGESPVPTFLEISGEVTSVAIEEEFQSWGHSDIDSLLLHRLHGDSPTVVVDVEPNGTRFFVLLWEDVTSTFLWHEIGTRPSTWSELDFMSTLGSLGKPRSAVLAMQQLSTRICVVQFEDVAQVQQTSEQVGWHIADLPRFENSGPSVTFLERLHHNVNQQPGGMCTIRPGCDLDAVKRLLYT